MYLEDTKFTGVSSNKSGLTKFSEGLGVLMIFTPATLYIMSEHSPGVTTHYIHGDQAPFRDLVSCSFWPGLPLVMS